MVLLLTILTTILMITDQEAQELPPSVLCKEIMSFDGIVFEITYMIPFLEYLRQNGLNGISFDPPDHHQNYQEAQECP